MYASSFVFIAGVEDYPRDQRAVAYLALLQVEAGFILNTRYKHKRAR